MQQLAKNQLDTVKNNKPLLYGIISVVVLIVLWFAYRWYKSDKARRASEPVLITSAVSAKRPLAFAASKLPNSVIGTEYTYTAWLYINNYDYKYGELKHVFHKGTSPSTVADTIPAANPLVMFYPKENKLLIRVDTVKNNGNPDYNAYYSSINKLNDTHICDISNIPLQKWVHLSIVLWNLSVDVYENQ